MKSNPIDKVAYLLLVIGGINWGLVGLLEFNLVAELFGEATALSRIVYTLVGVSALYAIYNMATKMSSRSG